MITKILAFLTMGYNYLLKRKAPDENSEIEVDQPRKDTRQISCEPPAKRRRIVESYKRSAKTVVEEFRKNSKNYTRDPNSTEHSENVHEMVGRIQEQCDDVERDDQELFRQAEHDIRQQISNDPILNNRLQREAKQKPDVNVTLTKCFNVLSSFLFSPSPPNNESGDESDHESDNKTDDVLLETSPRTDGKRVKLMNNITTNLKDPIPVYDHVAKNCQSVESLESITFLYTDRNILSGKLKSLDAEFEKPENKIKCNCHTKEGGYVNCWENPTCPCYQTNMKLRKNQVERESSTKKGSFYHEPTNFSTFDPLHFNTDSFYCSIGFACSEECSCKGCCSNNSTFLADKKINRLEIIRESLLTGFGVRTLNFIPAGTVVCEFTGEMVDHESIEIKDVPYAFEIVNCEEKIRDELIVAVNAKGKLKRLMEEAYTGKTWFLNSKKIGNVPRCFNHSCEANTTTIRVFQKGFSPSQIRFLVVTTEDVFPGEELTFYYGESYLEEHLRVCGCGKQSCVSRKKKTVPSREKIRKDLERQYKRRFREFKETVLDNLP